MQNVDRCSWVNSDEEYIYYHDNIWGRRVTDDDALYEQFILELLQSGLSYYIIFKKKNKIKKLMDDFNKQKIKNYQELDIENLLKEKDMIKNKKKIEAIVINTKVFISIEKEYKTFNNYLNAFTNNKIIYEVNKTSNNLSDLITKDLKERGMKQIGTKTIYAYLQAIGVIYSHEKNCYLYKR